MLAVFFLVNWSNRDSCMILVEEQWSLGVSWGPVSSKEEKHKFYRSFIFDA